MDASTKPEYAAKKAVAKTEPEEKPDNQIVKKFTTLVIDIKPVDSSIYLNGKFFGVSPVDGKIKNLRLKSGKYLLEVVKPGFKTFRKLLKLSGQKSIELTVNLEKN